MLLFRVSSASMSGRLARRVIVSTLAVVVVGCNVLPGSGPQRIDVHAQPNGIAVRPGDGDLFITDDRSNAILWSHDHVTFSPYARVPVVAGQPNSLGQAVLVQPGTLLVARFGFGESGALFVATSQGDAQPLAGLAPERRRLGLAVIGPGRVMSSWFVKAGNQPAKGGVSLVSYDAATHAATERDLIVGLAKPVGLAVHGNALLVSDQDRDVILRYDMQSVLAAQTPVPADSGAVSAQIAHPDLLAIDSVGSVYTKCDASSFCRIASDGTVTRVADGFQNARGVAIDEARHVLYVVDRRKSPDMTPSVIRILPLSR